MGRSCWWAALPVASCRRGMGSLKPRKRDGTLNLVP